MRYDGARARPYASNAELMERIISWANISTPDDNEKRVFLLTGPAASGKSTMAHSVASHFDHLERLASSFFCSSSKPDKSRSEMVLCTIARDIADRNIQIRHNLWDIVKDNRSLRKTTSISEQFERLIKEPTNDLVMVGPMVLVIDALDECGGNPDKRSQLIKLLIERSVTLPTNFRIFITTSISTQWRKTGCRRPTRPRKPVNLLASVRRRRSRPRGRRARNRRIALGRRPPRRLRSPSRES